MVLSDEVSAILVPASYRSSPSDFNVVLIVSDPMLKEYVIEFRRFIPPTRQISGNDALRVNYRRPFSLDSSTRFAFCCAKNPDRRRQLIPEFSSVLTKYPQLSLLLAVEAAKVQQPLHGVWVAAAEQSLREALSVIGGRLAARADGPITTLAISADSRWVVTGSDDNTARLWLFK
jgi:WD40 repeat protein